MRFAVAVSGALPLCESIRQESSEQDRYWPHVKIKKPAHGVPAHHLLSEKELRTAQGITSNRNLSGCDIRSAPFKTVIHLYQSHKNKRRNKAGKEYAAVPDVFHSM